MKTQPMMRAIRAKESIKRDRATFKVTSVFAVIIVLVSIVKAVAEAMLWVH